MKLPPDGDSHISIISKTAEDEGFDSIKVALRQAVARGAHPRRI